MSADLTTMNRADHERAAITCRAAGDLLGERAHAEAAAWACLVPGCDDPPCADCRRHNATPDRRPEALDGVEEPQLPLMEGDDDGAHPHDQA